MGKVILTVLLLLACNSYAQFTISEIELSNEQDPWLKVNDTTWVSKQGRDILAIVDSLVDIAQYRGYRIMELSSEAVQAKWEKVEAEEIASQVQALNDSLLRENEALLRRNWCQVKLLDSLQATLDSCIAIREVRNSFYQYRTLEGADLQIQNNCTDRVEAVGHSNNA